MPPSIVTEYEKRAVGTHHMFSPLHELLVDYFAGIIGTRLDMNGLLYDGIRSATQRLSSAILIHIVWLDQLWSGGRFR
jgi:hypothetical protein